jgi:hypothetical protein
MPAKAEYRDTGMPEYRHYGGRRNTDTAAAAGITKYRNNGITKN